MYNVFAFFVDVTHTHEFHFSETREKPISNTLDHRESRLPFGHVDVFDVPKDPNRYNVVVVVRHGAIKTKGNYKKKKTHSLVKNICEIINYLSMYTK